MNTINSPLLGLSQRLPPSNLQAEQALLGALLANNRAYEPVSEYLAPAHFADPIHGRIFQAIARRIESGQLADAVTLKGEFEHSGVLEEVGGHWPGQHTRPWRPERLARTSLVAAAIRRRESRRSAATPATTAAMTRSIGNRQRDPGEFPFTIDENSGEMVFQR
jgi:replicative DNA helicase